MITYLPLFPFKSTYLYRSRFGVWSHLYLCRVFKTILIYSHFNFYRYVKVQVSPAEGHVKGSFGGIQTLLSASDQPGARVVRLALRGGGRTVVAHLGRHQELYGSPDQLPRPPPQGRAFGGLWRPRFVSY